MSLFDPVRRQITPIHPEGYIFIAAFGVGALLLSYVATPLGWIGAILTLWCAYFFRDPRRVTPLRDGLVVSPADGVVSSIGFFPPPPELGLGEASLQRVSIFMSVFDVHVNRAPVAGRILRIVYKPGLFLNADLDKASEDNERSGMVIESASGVFGVVQIAGLIARRIVSFVREGDQLSAGERFGLIRFGSRVDVTCPKERGVLIGLGACAIAGETVLADMRGGEARLTFRQG